MDDTVKSVKAVPTNAQIAAKAKVDEVAKGVQSIPDKIAEAAKVRKKIVKATVSWFANQYVAGFSRCDGLKGEE